MTREVSGPPSWCCYWRPSLGAALSASESWEPGRNVPLDCTQDSVFLISCSGKTALCCFHTSLQVHFPSLAPAIMFLSATKGDEQLKLLLPGLRFPQTSRWSSHLWEEHRVSIISEAVGPPHRPGLRAVVLSHESVKI